MPGFTKLLIANRGEIACRIIATAHRLGYSTVAVFSDADRNARHVGMADEAVHIGPAEVGASYLDSEKILAAARQCGADAIHPGYGFLSENAHFATRCAEEGICFIGPSVAAIQLMGSKRESKLAMLAAGVPCVPGYEGEQQQDEYLIAEARHIGFPLMIKASAGGGGRGMRRVGHEDELQEALQRARSEALHAFGNGELILEKAVDEARHVEIQIFGDQHGNYVHLGERDCSLQRRHQKVIEEAPSPAVTPDLRERMGAAAVLAARACAYVGAGTVEFLLAPDGSFYFLEMNTRLQVEHPVTEAVTGEDLVEWQLRIARGEPLPRQQDEIFLRGHAIELRLYAEDTARGFLPQTGPVLLWRPAPENLARTDHGMREGTPVSRFYDPMLAKIICHGRDRAEALRKAERALRETRLLGVTHNKAFLLDLLHSNAFRAGLATTRYIDEHYHENAGALQPTEASYALAALVLTIPTVTLTPQRPGMSFSRQHLQADGKPVEANVQSVNGEIVACCGDTRITLVSSQGAGIVYRIDGIQKRACFVRHERHILIDSGEGPLHIENLGDRPPQAREGGGSGILKAPLDGAVTAVMVETGQSVKRGDTLVVIEAMKMEHLVRADMDGIIAEIGVKTGNQVRIRQMLARVAPTP